MDETTVTRLLGVWVVAATIGGIAMVLLGHPLSMGVGSVAIILGLVSLMPLANASLD